ncbi:MAG TPA: hypothetical protein VFQ61_33455, partial [Polyangiaceae bacterium]|nr:hypothetical protein [Polyangiaceae bacterium]
TVHYDRAILDQGDSCPSPTNAGCAGCGECGAGLTCMAEERDAGTCASCATDSDCCSPLVCDNGRCRALLTE